MAALSVGVGAAAAAVADWRRLEVAVLQFRQGELEWLLCLLPWTSVRQCPLEDLVAVGGRRA